MPTNWLGAQLINVPESLASVTTVGAGESDQGKSDKGGLSQGAIDSIWSSVEDLYRSAAYPAITFCLRRDGDVVLNRSLGHARGNGPQDAKSTPKHAAQPDTPICIYSASKAVTAILVHKLAEEGGIDLDQRVSYYLPEFAAAGKRDTTISQVLAHRGGFPMFDLPPEERDPERLLDWDNCIELICAAEPSHESGERLAYHAITGGFILGEVIQRVSQMSLNEYLDTRIRQPMGMQYFTYGLEQKHRDKVAMNYAAGQPVRFPVSKILEKALSAPIDEVIEISNSEIFMQAVVPAGNLYCSAEELSRFYQMLLDDGVWQGQQILKPATVARAIKPNGKLCFDHTLKAPMRYSEGLMLGGAPVGLYGPMTDSAYGHLGFMNILGWADPARKLSAGLLVTGKAVLGGHLVPLSQLITNIARQCKE